MSAFNLPDGNVQISFSGGRTSAYMLYKILEANNGLPKRAVVCFQNTGREMPQTLDFVHEVSERWNVPIVWLEYCRKDDKPSYEIVSHNSAARNGEPFIALIEAKRILPNALMRFCTVELKINTAKRYLKSLGWKSWKNAVGIRADEPERFNRETKKDVWTPWRPMVDAGIRQDDVNMFWKSQPFDLGLPVIGGKTMYGNCDGCFLKSEAQLVMLAREHPEKFDWWLELESKHSHRGNYGLFNNQKPMENLKKMIDEQPDWVFSQQGYFCQADGGECTG